MKKFTLLVEPKAVLDNQVSIYFFENQVKGLGKKFHAEVKSIFKTIAKNPYFQIRYRKCSVFAIEKVSFSGSLQNK